VRNLRALESFDALARRYGKRPSDFLDGLNSFQRMCIDMRAAKAGVDAQKRAEAEEKARRARKARGL